MNTVNDGSTEKMTVNQKLELLRTKMKERGMDAYMVPTADFHESEYVGDHFKCRQFLTDVAAKLQPDHDHIEDDGFSGDIMRDYTFSLFGAACA